MHPVKRRILEASIQTQNAIRLYYDPTDEGCPSFELASPVIDETNTYLVAESSEAALHGSFPVSTRTLRLSSGGPHEAAWISENLSGSGLEYLITWCFDYDAEVELDRILFFSEEDAIAGLVLLET